MQRCLLITRQPTSIKYRTYKLLYKKRTSWAFADVKNDEIMPLFHSSIMTIY